MLERLPAPDAVLALKVSGAVSEADVDQAIAWMDAALAAHPTIHVFAEVEHLTGVDPSGLVHGWSRGAHLLTQLRRFGRVGIVSADQWLRVLARLESAVLPGIAYQVAEPARRDEILAWVRDGPTSPL